MTLHAKVAAEVRAEKARHQITTSTLARRAKLSRTAMTARLNNKVNFGIDDLDAVAKTFGLTVWQLLANAEAAASSEPSEAEATK